MHCLLQCYLAVYTRRISDVEFHSHHIWKSYAIPMTKTKLYPDLNTIPNPTYCTNPNHDSKTIKAAFQQISPQYHCNDNVSTYTVRPAVLAVTDFPSCSTIHVCFRTCSEYNSMSSSQRVYTVVLFCIFVTDCVFVRSSESSCFLLINSCELVTSTSKDKATEVEWNLLI